MTNKKTLSPARLNKQDAASIKHLTPELRAKLLPVVKAARLYMHNAATDDNLIKEIFELSKDDALLRQLEDNYAPWSVTRCLLAVHYLRTLGIHEYRIGNIITDVAHQFVKAY